MSARLPARAALAAALLASAWTARAAEVQLNPVVVTLAPSARSGMIAVRNQGSETVRFELQPRSWDESPSGQMQLGPTADLVVYPPVLTLGPGEERNVRVGVASPSSFGATERSYRLFIQEMAPSEQPGGAAQVRMLSRIGIPVFLAPVRSSEKAVVAGLAARAGAVTFRLVNEGTVHFRPGSVKVVGRGAGGASLFEADLPAWYVLAGGHREYTAAIPAEACRTVRSIEAQVDLPGVPPARIETKDPCSP
ncbi:MAG TPA: fimbria/pilus periplasmic chaperone [Anaeromyxobacteraceae bacterium]|nr:fimbria/pilus periplasmic chaperone [Anaeromyxobacteraceae bacterium]